MADESPKVSKPFIVIAGIGLLVIVAFLAMKVLGGGGGGGSESASSDSTAATAPAGAPAASTTTTTAPGEPSTPNQSFDVFTTKDPFQPLVAETSSGSFDQSSTNTTSPPVADSGGVVPPPIPQDQAPAAGTPVSVLEVYDESGVVKARVIVGSAGYTVAVGETFATSYRVVSLDTASGCGQFQYGDTPFQLCVGQQTLK
jgi:hypothetical protein